MLYELIAGVPPYVAANQVALAEKICKQSPPPLPEATSPQLRRLIQRTLCKHPQERPTIVDCFLEASAACSPQPALQPSCAPPSLLAL